MTTTYYAREYNRASDDSTCPLCGGTTYEGKPCSTCFLPVKVIESIRSRPQSPRFVGVLGPSGVGKTVYLGMLLDLLARGECGLHGLARSPFTLNLHRKLILALERQRFPEKTPIESDRWDWVHCEIYAGKSKAPFEIVAPDVAGEAVAGELENQGTYKTIRALIGRCAGLVILIDVVQVVADGKGQELFAMQLISYLDALKPRKRNRKIDVPVAIVFTKTDLCDEPIRDAEELRQGQYLVALWPVSDAAGTLLVLLLGRGRFDRPAGRPQWAGDARSPARRASGHHRAVRLDGESTALLDRVAHRCSSREPSRNRRFGVWAEQAIFTSLPRRGRGGYHLVSRSRGVGDERRTGPGALGAVAWRPDRGREEPDQRQLPPAAQRPVCPLAHLRRTGRV